MVDEGQQRGEIARASDTLKRGPVVLGQDNGGAPAPASLTDLGIARQRLHEARKLATLSEAELGTAAVNHATVIKARALKRMAELVDEGQQRGEIAQARDTLVPVVLGRDNRGAPAPASLTDLGITRQRLHEARNPRETERGRHSRNA